MIINKEFLKEKGACIGGLRWFFENFPTGGEYQDVLNKLAEENKGDCHFEHAGINTGNHPPE